MPGTLTYRSMAGAARICTWYIRHVDIFRHLSPRDADSLAHAMTVRRYAPGQLIVDQDTQQEIVYVLRSGTVRLFHRKLDGRETTVVRSEPGHVSGVTALR